MMPSVLYLGPTRAGRKVAGNFTPISVQVRLFHPT